jgi:uncharacterized protein YlaI
VIGSAYEFGVGRILYGVCALSVSTKGAKLMYCLVDGQARHVSEFAKFPPKSRPAALCPECGERVVLKLGSTGRRAHHAAHKPGSVCAITNPESALHLNCKIHIYRQLLLGRELYIRQACAGWVVPKMGEFGGGQCQCRGERSRPCLWLEAWDGVGVERHVGTRKPDILFYRNGTPVAAIEIYATHAVDEWKRAELKELGIPWLEVKADERIYQPDEYGETEPWSLSKPLPYINSDSPIPTWTCDKCSEEPARQAARMKARREAEVRAAMEEAQAAARRRAEALKYAGPENRVIKAKAVCLFRDDGLYEKHELLICERTVTPRSDEVAAIYIRHGKDGRILAEENVPITDESRARITSAYKAWRGLFGASYRVVDITGWVSYEEMMLLLHRWKSPYFYDERKQQWVMREVRS